MSRDATGVHPPADVAIADRPARRLNSLLQSRRLSTDAPPPFSYAAALDGLRALAVVAVLGYHLDIGWMRGGFLGVDLFFVISGFLITRLLLDEQRQSGGIALGGFWMRRFRRLVPPLVIVVALSIVATRLWGTPGQWQAMRGDAVAALGYVANWRFVFNETSYFETLAGPSPLRHIWSLAVEEQWYVLWPLAMIALAPWILRGRRAQWVSGGLLAAGVLSAIWMAVLFDPTDVSRVYYGTDTRAQQLLVGAALAWLTVAAPARFSAGRVIRNRFVVTATLVGFIVAVATVGDEDAWLYHGGLFVLSIGAAVLVVAASVPGSDGPLGWLASPFFVGLGKRSYGIYLVHWPVFVFVGPPMGIDMPIVSLAVLQIAVTLALSEVMYRSVEMPVRTSDFRPLRLVAGWSAGGVAAALAAVTLLAADLPSLPDVDVLRPNLVQAAEPAPAIAPPVVQSSPAESSEQLALLPSDQQLTPPPDGEPSAPPAVPAPPPKLLLFGDSTAYVLAVNRPEELPAGWRSDAYARLGCAITDGDTIDVNDDKPTFRGPAACEEWMDDWSEVSAIYRPNLSVVMIGAWEVLDHIVDGQRLSFPSSDWSDHVERAIHRAVDAASAGGGHVVLLRLPCMEQASGTIINALARNDLGRVAEFNTILERVASSTPRASTLPLDELLCPGGEALDKINGEDVRYDGVHLTSAGVQFVWKWLDKSLDRFDPSTN